jgi:putative transposase
MSRCLNSSGEKDVLGLWIEQTEGAKFWLNVMNDLKARGLTDILIAVVGLSEAITSVFPPPLVQTCIVHLIRNSLSFVTWKDRKAILPLGERQTVNHCGISNITHN